MTEHEREYRRRYKRENRAFFKAHGLCVMCGREKAELGRTMCPDCLMKVCEYNERRLAKETPEDRKKRLEHQREISKALYERRKAAGICTKCGQRKAAPGKTLCTECLIRRRRYDHERRDSHNRDYENTCSRCRKKPRMDGKKVCEDCYQILIDLLAKARKKEKPYNAFRDGVDGYWKAVIHEHTRKEK